MAINLTVTNNTRETAILNWTSDVGATSYEVWRKKAYDTDGVAITDTPVLLTTITGTHYVDDTLKDTISPLTPDIVKNTQTKRSEITMNLKTRDLGTMYVYWIKAIISETSNVQSSYEYATSTSGLKGYKYLVKRLIDDKTEPVFEDEEKWIFSESDVINVTDLEDGQYVFYTKSVDEDGNESEVNKVFFYIRNKYLNIEKHLNQVPLGVRYNNRYRGPHESKKVDFMYMQIKNNINKLKDKLTTISKYVEVKDSDGDVIEYVNTTENVTYKAAMNQIKFDETTIIERPMIKNREVLQTIEEIEIKLNDMREELKYEKRND